MRGGSANRLLDKVFKFTSSWRIVSSILWSLAVLAIVVYCVAGGLLAIRFFEAILAGGLGDEGAEIRNVGLVLAALLGAPLVVWRSKIAYDQAQTAQERMITDRFSKAVDQLGSVRRVPRIQTATETDERSNWEEEQPNIEVRLGGLYTLQRIFEDSLSDHIRVVETVCAYVRRNSLRQEQGTDEVEIRNLDVDIQAATKILGERSYERCVYEMNSLGALDLSTATLQKSNLNSLKFPMVDLEKADLRYSTLRYTDFRQAWLGWVNFQFADFYKCCLRRAALRGADLRNTNVTEEMLMSAHGVKSGFGKAHLPAKVKPPTHWLAAQEAENDSETLRAAYFTHYREFLSRDENAWMTIPGKQVSIGEVWPYACS